MTSKTIWPLLTALLLAATALAGCLSDGGSDLDTDAGADGDTSGNQTASGDDPVSFDPPTVVITVTGDNVTANETDNGTVYEFVAGANVTLDASGSTDAAEGNLSFAWDLGDGTTTEGPNVTYAFAAGNYTVTVTATSDVSNESATESIDIAAAETVAARDPVTLTIEGTITGAWAGGYHGETNTHPLLVDHTWNRITVSIDFGTTAPDLDYGVTTPGGDDAGSVANFNEPTGNVFAPGEPPIVIEDPDLLAQLGEWTITVDAGTSVMGDYTLTILME